MAASGWFCSISKPALEQRRRRILRLIVQGLLYGSPGALEIADIESAPAISDATHTVRTDRDAPEDRERLVE
jgi:hypothetical protein